MRFPVLIFLIGILSMQVCAQDISNSFLVSELTADINQTGTIDVPSHGISRVIINFFVPQNTTNQFVGTSASLIKDSFGNSVLHMEYRHPSKKIRYSINSRIRVSGIKTKYIPTVYDVPEDFNIYLKPTKGIDCNDSRIRELAYSITNNSKSDFERIGKLAIWVYRNVQYDDYLKERVMNSTWVYENRRGTCDEFTTLFIALSRSIGIPARYVSGYKYSNGEWDRHAYSEVYIGEWIPVDPTNLEVGRLDATHIKFAVTDDNSVGSNLRVYGIFMNDVSWNSQTDIDILNYRMDKPIDYNLTISSDEFGAGDRAVVILKIMSTEYNVVKLILEECSSDFQFARVEDKEKYVILEPYKENIIYWVIDIDSNLNKNSLYYCPLLINSRFLELKDIVLNVNTEDQEKRDEVEISAELSSSLISMGSFETVFINVKRISGSNPVKLGIISEDYFDEFWLNPITEQNLKISFMPQKTGHHNLVIYTSTGSALNLQYQVEKGNNLYIDEIKYPEHLMIGDRGYVILRARNNRTEQQKLKIIVDYGNWQSVKNVVVKDILNIYIPIVINETGMRSISFHIVGEGIDTTKIIKLRVYDVPEVKADAVYTPHKNELVVNINVNRDIARNLQIAIGNRTKTINELVGGESVKFVTKSLDRKEFTVRYRDISGKEYAVNGTIRIRNEGIIDSIIRTFSSFIDYIVGLLLNF